MYITTQEGLNDFHGITPFRLCINEYHAQRHLLQKLIRETPESLFLGMVDIYCTDITVPGDTKN
jgi:hypothetical protein